MVSYGTSDLSKGRHLALIDSGLRAAVKGKGDPYECFVTDCRCVAKAKCSATAVNYSVTAERHSVKEGSYSWMEESCSAMVANYSAATASCLAATAKRSVRAKSCRVGYFAKETPMVCLASERSFRNGNLPAAARVCRHRSTQLWKPAR